MTYREMSITAEDLKQKLSYSEGDYKPLNTRTNRNITKNERVPSRRYWF
jgi:hypothetical protein